jgi:hypothetical protein
MVASIALWDNRPAVKVLYRHRRARPGDPRLSAASGGLWMALSSTATTILATLGAAIGNRALRQIAVR